MNEDLLSRFPGQANELMYSYNVDGYTMIDSTKIPGTLYFYNNSRDFS